MRLSGSVKSFVLVVCAVVIIAGCTSLGAIGSALLGNQVIFAPAQLQGYLNQRFPRDYDKLNGLVTLSVLNPRLSIPYGSNRLRLDFDVGFGLAGNNSRQPAGHFGVSSGLRFDPATHGLHLEAPTLEAVDAPRLGRALSGNGRDLINQWLQQYARDEPVYRLDAGLMQQLASRRIGRTTIENGSVVVHLDQ